LYLLVVAFSPMTTSELRALDRGALAGFELRPAPRIAVSLQHELFEWADLSETLTVGLGSFPDLEVRAALIPESIDPLLPFVALRVRRIHLEELPPVELYTTLGLAFTTDVARLFSLTGGAGLRLQLPPLTDEAASDPGSYVAENVSLELFVGARFRVW
jgi:hypothetical protein